MGQAWTEKMHYLMWWINTWVLYTIEDNSMSSIKCLRYNLQTLEDKWYWLNYNLHSGLMLAHHLGQTWAAHSPWVKTTLHSFCIARPLKMAQLKGLRKIYKWRICDRTLNGSHRLKYLLPGPVQKNVAGPSFQLSWKIREIYHQLSYLNIIDFN